MCGGGITRFIFCGEDIHIGHIFDHVGEVYSIDYKAELVWAKREGEKVVRQYTWPNFLKILHKKTILSRADKE